MNARMHRVGLGLVATALLLWGCDERIRYADSILVPVTVSGDQATAVLWRTLPPDLLERTGGEVPDPWPADLPPVAVDLPLETWVVLRHASLEEVGRDLEAAGRGEALLVPRWIAGRFEPGDLNHPLRRAELLAGPEVAMDGPDPERARPVARLAPLEAGTFEFVPGGRARLEESLARPESTLGLRVWMDYDTGARAGRPAGEALIEVELHVDVLY